MEVKIQSIKILRINNNLGNLNKTSNKKVHAAFKVIPKPLWTKKILTIKLYIILIVLSGKISNYSFNTVQIR